MANVIQVISGIQINASPSHLPPILEHAQFVAITVKRQMVSLQDAHAQETLRIVWMEPVQTVIVKKKYIVGENVSLVPPLVSIIREIAHRVMMVKLRIVVPHTPIALANVPRRGNIALMALVQSATQVHNIGIVMVKGVLRVTINVVRVMKDVHHVREPMYVRMEPVNLVPLVAFTIMENAQSVEATVAPVIRDAMTLVHRVSIVLIIPVQRAKRINIGMVQSVQRVGTTVVPIIKTVQYAPSLRYVSIKPVNFVSMELSMTMENAQRVGRAVVPNTPIVLKHVHRPSIVLIIPVQHARRINIGMVRSVPHVGPNVETTFLDVHAQETLWIALMEPVQTVIAKIKYIMAKPVNLVPLVAFTIMDNAQIVALTVGTAFQDVQRALPPPYARTEPVNLVPLVTFTIMEHAHRALMLPLPTAEPKNVRKDVPMRGSIVLMVLAQSVSRVKNIGIRQRVQIVANNVVRVMKDVPPAQRAPIVSITHVANVLREHTMIATVEHVCHVLQAHVLNLIVLISVPTLVRFVALQEVVRTANLVFTLTQILKNAQNAKTVNVEERVDPVVQMPLAIMERASVIVAIRPLPTVLLLVVVA